ncbi:serine/threonine-protein kinase bik1 [Quercus suber]|uniref:Serine/threonine-protein kinase bik1 n=1 Tax=Quercus suber TaxID=58331 RepID=A0AAW0KPJ4_QUESU
MDFAKLEVFTSEDLKACTNNFNIKSLVGVIQFGKLYRGKIKGVMTGTEEEIKGVIYDLSPLDSLQNLMVKDDLNWLQRINVVLEIARLLKFLHGQDKPFLIYNINASHIVVDWDFKPKLIDFGQIGKGIIGEMSRQNKQITMPIRCHDPYFTIRGGDWDTSSEVFSFGVILLGLIAKRTCELEKPDIVLDRLLHVWAKNEYKPQCSLVHKSLQEDWGYHAEDGIAITELGMCCIEFFPRNRPTMKDDFKPKLIDFGQIGKGIIGEMSRQNKQITMPIRCHDPYFTIRGGDWDTSSEVFSFGVILLGLIAKRTCELEKPDIVLDRLLHVWAKKEYKPQCSLVHKSLQEDWGYHAEDGIAITELGMCCIEFFPRNRPTMKDVVERLESLHILQRLGDSRAHKRGKKFHDNAMCL